MEDFKKILSLKISEYESLFNSCDKGFMDNCKYINGSVSKLLKENESHEKILQFINDCIQSKKTVSKEDLLTEYELLFNTEDEFYGKEFKNNCKFINGAVKRMLKNKETEEYILSFINDCVKYHKNTYYLMSLPQDKYFEAIIKENKTK